MPVTKPKQNQSSKQTTKQLNKSKNKKNNETMKTKQVCFVSYFKWSNQNVLQCSNIFKKNVFKIILN